jgi:hypothetical protein
VREARLTLAHANENAEALVVRVDMGVSDTKVRRFRPGRPVATLTVGSQGAWKVEAAGVASVHAYLRFDGSQLFVATSDPRRPVVVDGIAMPETWSRLNPPCLVSLGRASLSIERDVAAATPGDASSALSPIPHDVEGEPTCRRSSPMLALGSHADAEQGDTDLPPGEPTRLQFGHVEAAPEPAGTRAVQISSLPPTLLNATASAPEEAPGGESTPGPAFRVASRIAPRRILQAVGLVVGLVMVIGVYRMASPRRAASPSPDVSNSAEAADVPSTPRAAAPIGATAPSPLAAPIEVPAPSPGRSGATTGARQQPTLERRAADAFAAGDFPTALRLYRELAAQNPDQPAFRQAVRVLEEK